VYQWYTLLDLRAMRRRGVELVALADGLEQAASE
jgi:hypothetical protein